MASRPDLEESEEFWSDLKNPELSKSFIMEKHNCSSSFVADRRKAIGFKKAVVTSTAPATSKSAGESEQHNPDGSSSYTRYSERPWGEEDFRKFLLERGTDPDTVTFTFGWTSNPAGGFWNKLNNVRKKDASKSEGAPEWPVIHPARDPIVIKPLRPTPRASRYKTAIVGADTQIGFDMDDQGNLTPFHDDAAIDILLQIIGLEYPDQVILAGDILDLAEQGRWTQESRFAQTTQYALERGRILAAEIAARTDGRQIWVEGNHDKRMQGFMEANAKSAMGLKKAGYPHSWPVMSIPNLVGLDEFGAEYIDAYPAGQHWITDGLRVIHGTKVNSNGSTAAQYANATPHISTIFGHTHRLETQSKTTFDRQGKIRTMNVNPGCLCRIDGAVPSVHGARHLDGSKATYFEDWQQGVVIVRYLDDGSFFIESVQIDEGVAFHGGQELVAA